MANLTLGCNSNLCVVIDKDIFIALAGCSKYSSEFLHNRLKAFKEHGVPKGSTNHIAILAVGLEDANVSSTVIKYIASRQVVISTNMPIGSYVAGHKPYAIIKQDGDKIVTGRGLSI